MYHNFTSNQPAAVHPVILFGNFSAKPPASKPLQAAMRYYEDEDEVDLDIDHYWDVETDDFTLEKTFRYDDEDDDLTWYGEDDTQWDE